MATIRLIPSTYAVSNTTYLSVSNPDNMYTNTDSTTYATVTNSRASTTSYYLYIRGFNFNDIPSGATINSFTVKLKGYESGLSTSTSYAPRLANGTSAISNTTASQTLSTSTRTITIPTGALTWQQIVNYGSNFTITVYVRRSNSNTTGYAYIQGAEILVDYTVPNPHTITSTLVGNGVITPSGSLTYYDDDEYELHIKPTNLSDTVVVTNNSVDVTSQLIPPGSSSDTEERVLGTYTLVSGGFNGQGATYFSGLVGKGVDNTQTTTNYYSSGNGTIAVFTYDMGVEIPSDAVITSCYVEVNGHAESTSQGSEYMCAQLISGSTNITNELNFKNVGTSNSTQTLTATTLPTVAQCENLKLQCRLGYYGGAINGATLYLEYNLSTDYYLYTYTVNGDATIIVTIGSTSTTKVFIKVNGSWVEYSKVYKKQNGSWVEQTDLSNVFDTNANYVKGN